MYIYFVEGRRRREERGERATHAYLFSFSRSAAMACSSAAGNCATNAPL